MSNIPLSLYIHFPWCIRKCPYCDFNSHALKNELPEERYIDLLLQDLRHDLKKVPNRKLHSIFMGGGTPSLFSPSAIARCLQGIQEEIEFEHNAIEITLEANPGTAEQEKFHGFRAAGVNRLSIGIQSFQKDKLQALGRIHDDKAATAAIAMAVAAGFNNYNIDLMHGLPNQSISDALSDITTAVGFSPPHFSWYQLTLEPNTLFHSRPPPLPEENVLQAIQEQGHAVLLGQHYQHYEVSAYCQPDHHCKHNMNYWTFGDYLGIGAGAHGKVTDYKSGEVVRYTKVKHPREYLTAPIVQQSTQLIEKSQLPFEFMLNALRLQRPLTWDLFKQRTGLLPETILPAFKKLQAKQLISITEQEFCLTPLGRRFLNNVLTEFLP